MSATTTTDYEDLRQYLLGRLSEEEERTLEVRLFADSELFELAEATEAEILDECFRGELAREDCQELLDHLGASPAGRERIALAQALIDAIDAVDAIGAVGAIGAIERAVPKPEQGKVIPFPRPGFLARPIVRAAALAAALAGAAVVVWQVQPGSSPEPANRTAAHPAASKPVAPRPSVPAAVQPLVYELSLTTFRGGEDSPSPLRIAGQTEVELRLPLPEGETSAAYDVSLKRGGENIWGPRRHLRPKPPESRLAVRLPASALAAGTYEVEVRGVGPDGSTELVGTRSFSVIR
jgi:anti-sigma factor RsiW